MRTSLYSLANYTAETLPMSEQPEIFVPTLTRLERALCVVAVLAFGLGCFASGAMWNTRAGSSVAYSECINALAR